MFFEEASRLKLRYETNRGNITTEDVWDLPLTSGTGVSLDDLAKELNKKVKESEEESFVVQKSKSNIVLDLKFSIVKHIIKVRLAEIEQKENEALNKAKKDKLIDIIGEKEDEGLKNKSISELKKMVKKL